MEPDILYRGCVLTLTRRQALWQVWIGVPDDNDCPQPSAGESIVSGVGRENVIAEAKRRIDALLDG